MSVSEQPSTPATTPSGPEDRKRSLTDLEPDSWRLLQSEPESDGSAGAGSKTMTLATCTASGADARMVILRKIDAERKYVWFHTDARSEKVLQLEAFPNATILYWDDARQVQLRLTVETRLHTDDYVADEHWKNLWMGGRKMYLSEQIPGSEQPGPYPGFPPHLDENLPTQEESEAGRPNFAVIECRVLAMEYLHLSRAGQTRARFQYEPVQKFAWLAP